MEPDEEITEHYDDGESETDYDYDEDGLEQTVAEIEDIENPIERQAAAEEKLNG